ncbi:MAG: AMP-binding protein [Pseudomonadales bacterium]|nr:AMP-binding protein [Pseudomonadales bacterium]
MSYITPLAQFSKRVQANPSTPYLHQPTNGEWTSYTWIEVDDMARRIASGLQALGLQPGDRVAILGKNSVEWLVADFAIAMAGFISVPIYSTAGSQTISYVLQHSGAKALFVGKLDKNQPLLDSLQAMAEKIPSIGFPYEGIVADQQWNDWLQQYEPLATLAEPVLEDTCTIVYTSGSTGNPKGVVLTHQNLAAAAIDAVSFYPPGKNRVLSYLPMAHITERSLVTMVSLYADVEIFFNDSLATFVDDLRYARPTMFLSVPRLWAKFQSQVLEQIPNQRLQRLLSIPVLGKRVAKKIRANLGFSDCKAFGSGTAPISPSLLQWYQRLGIDIAEGWGMTETSGGACSNQPFFKSRLGTIGVPMPSAEMKIADSGELLIRGPAITKAYYNNPEATAASFDGDWFKTGDKALCDSDGVWRIVGRVKEQFKTAKGKYVAPVPIESLLGSNANIEQSCVMGSGLPQPVALVVTNANGSASREELSQSLLSTLEATNKKLESHERLSSIVVCDEPWSIENDLLTPTMKLKRDRIEARYRDLVEKKGDKKVDWAS